MAKAQPGPIRSPKTDAEKREIRGPLLPKTPPGK